MFDSEGVGFIKVTMLKRFLVNAQLEVDDASCEYVCVCVCVCVCVRARVRVHACVAVGAQFFYLCIYCIMTCVYVIYMYVLLRIEYTLGRA